MIYAQNFTYKIFLNNFSANISFSIIFTIHGNFTHNFFQSNSYMISFSITLDNIQLIICIIFSQNLSGDFISITPMISSQAFLSISSLSDFSGNIIWKTSCATSTYKFTIQLFEKYIIKPNFLGDNIMEGENTENEKNNTWFNRIQT